MSMIHRAKIRREGEIPPAPTTEKVVEEVVEEKVVESTPEYNKNQINRMKTTDLQALAKELNIDGADEMSGSALKPIIIEKLGL